MSLGSEGHFLCAFFAPFSDTAALDLQPGENAKAFY